MLRISADTADRPLLRGGNQHTPLTGDGDNPELGVSSQRPDFLTDDNQPDARSPGQVPHYDHEHAFELRSTGGEAREPAHGGQL